MRKLIYAMRIPIDQMEQQELAIFTYPKADILLEANKRSSYLGKMRGNKENPDFITRMSLTEGESFLSEEMLADAVEQTYEWVQAFGKRVETPYGVVEDEEHPGVYNITFTLQPCKWWDRNAFGRVERYLKEALINYILYRWYEIVNVEEAELYFNKYEDYAHKAQIGMNAESGVLERRFNTPYNTIFR